MLAPSHIEITSLSSTVEKVRGLSAALSRAGILERSESFLCHFNATVRSVTLSTNLILLAVQAVQVALFVILN